MRILILALLILSVFNQTDSTYRSTSFDNFDLFQEPLKFWQLWLKHHHHHHHHHHHLYSPMWASASNFLTDGVVAPRPTPTLEDQGLFCQGYHTSFKAPSTRPRPSQFGLGSAGCTDRWPDGWSVSSIRVWDRRQRAPNYLHQEAPRWSKSAQAPKVCQCWPLSTV